jgi:hypothetical protein
MTTIHRKSTFLLALTVFLGMGLYGCNFPGMQATPDMFATSAALTVSAQLTQVSDTTTDVPPTTPAPTVIATTPAPPTSTPTNTVIPSITPTEATCDKATFIKDVTIPDGTELDPGEDFTKTWRLRNDGSCTWTSSYSLVFDNGDSMGGPASQQLTSGTVSPGETLDISVDLTAPNNPGTFRGNWKLRNNAGVVFGVGSSGNAVFYVEIEVVPDTTTVEVTQVDGESGSVRSNDEVKGAKDVGDTSADLSSQVFLSFDISAIPEDATITEVVADFSSHDQLGDPFGDLGCLDIFKYDYIPLDSTDYFTSEPSGRLIRWCSTNSLNSPVIDKDMVTALQSKVGSSRMQFRLQFQTDISSDGEADMVRFVLPGESLELKVTYYIP